MAYRHVASAWPTVLAFGFLMLVSLVISSVLVVLEHWAGSHMGAKVVPMVVNQLVAFVIITGLFVALMCMSVGPRPRLRGLVLGAVVGAVQFGIGRFALVLYLSKAAAVSVYGAYVVACHPGGRRAGVEWCSSLASDAGAAQRDDASLRKTAC